MEPRRRYYGITEVAEALGQARTLVTVWRRRGSWGMPPPDDELSAGPIWRGETIEPWIDLTRVRIARDEGAPAPPGPALVRRVVRRSLRLAALVLEEEQRHSLLTRATAELVETRDDVAATADGPLRASLMRLYDAVPAEGSPALSTVAVLLADLVPLLTGLERPGTTSA